jgi:hypothetical protein
MLTNARCTPAARDRVDGHGGKKHQSSDDVLHSCAQPQETHPIRDRRDHDAPEHRVQYPPAPTKEAGSTDNWTLEVIEAARRSAITGTTVPLAP